MRKWRINRKREYNWLILSRNIFRFSWAILGNLRNVPKMFGNFHMIFVQSSGNGKKSSENPQRCLYYHNDVNCNAEVMGSNQFH